MAIRQCHNCKHNGKGDSECITCAMRKAHDSPMQGRVKPVPLPVLEKLAPEDARENPAKYSEADAAQTAARVSSASRGFPAFRTLLNRLEPGDTVAICGRWSGLTIVATMLPPNAGRI